MGRPEIRENRTFKVGGVDIAFALIFDWHGPNLFLAEARMSGWEAPLDREDMVTMIGPSTVEALERSVAEDEEDFVKEYL